MNCPKVLPHFPPATREDALNAIARALLRIRSQGWSCPALARELDCSADTVENASNEKSLLSFESIVLLATKFSDEFQLIEALWTMRPPAPVTADDHRAAIERHTEALVKLAGRAA